MLDYQVYGNSLPEAYHKALARAMHGSLVNGVKDETLECGMTMVVKDPLREPMISRFFPGGPADLEQYRMEMLDGILDFAVDDGRLPYTYHERIDYQLERTKCMLVMEPATRQAVITIREPMDVELLDPPCLQHIQLFVRGGRLDMTAMFRSNDAAKAAFMNAFALIMLQKRLADEMELQVGTYTHRANSFHVYKRDWEKVLAFRERCVLASVNPRDESCTYRYRGEWDEMMEDSRPAILEKLETLKAQKRWSV